MDTVIYHSQDYDGIFCREIARRFLGDQATYLGWTHGEPKIPMPEEGMIYVLDLPPDCLDGNPAEKFVVPVPLPLNARLWHRLVWIDHHETSIAKWPPAIFGYRIDGVAACRLAWQWFTKTDPLPDKAAFLDRRVAEPLAVRMAGEYDVWDKRDERAEVFQHGLNSVEHEPTLWQELLDSGRENFVEMLCYRGKAVQCAQRRIDATLARHRAFNLEWEGLRWLALNTARCNSLTFAAGVRREHDGVLGFYWNGRQWTVSLYGVLHRPEVDLAAIAVRHGGGGHRQACGFSCEKLPFELVSGSVS